MIHKAIASRDMVQSIINTIIKMPVEQATRRNILVMLGNNLDRLNIEVAKLKREFEEQEEQDRQDEVLDGLDDCGCGCGQDCQYYD